MPAEDCPSFHCRPSTTSTLFPPSLSTRQKPTTGTNDFGSAPTVSSPRSMVVGGAARAWKASAARPIADTMVVLTLVLMLMAVSFMNGSGGSGWLTAPPPGKRDQGGQTSEEPDQR